MARRRTLNYRDFRGDFDESEEGRRKKEEGEGDEVEEEDEDEEDEEEASDEEGDEEEAAEKGDEEEGDEEEEVPVVKKKPAKKEPKPKKAPAKPRSKKAKSKMVRVRVVWGVFNNSNQCVATYDFTRRGEAEEHATRLQTDKKQTHFIQPVKQAIAEEK